MDVMGQYAAELDCTTEADARSVARRFVGGAGSRGNAGSAGRRRSILSRTVELDVIPRLLLAHRAEARPAAPATGGCNINAGHVATLTQLTLTSDSPAISDFVAATQAQGFSSDTINLELLAPAALRLGVLWEEDVCNFTEVTIGLWRLHAVMREIGSAPAAAYRDGRAAPRALLVPLPGEQHTFGLAMVVDFFRRAGWNAWSGPVQSRAELATMVRSEWIDVVGFSLACDERLETARAEIRAVRAASCNPGLAVMVGGPPFVAIPSLAQAIGADGTAGDALMAVTQANALLQRQAERR